MSECDRDGASSVERVSVCDLERRLPRFASVSGLVEGAAKQNPDVIFIETAVSGLPVSVEASGGADQGEEDEGDDDARIAGVPQSPQKTPHTRAGDRENENSTET